MRYVDKLSASLGDLIWIAIVPTVLLAGWQNANFRAAKDYDPPTPGPSPEPLPERQPRG